MPLDTEIAMGYQSHTCRKPKWSTQERKPQFVTTKARIRIRGIYMDSSLLEKRQER
jgi:hypothetical protein